MPLSPEALYYQLGSLVAETPELAGATTAETSRWIERALKLVEMAGGLADTIQLRVAIENLDGVLRERNAQTILAIVQRALAKAEREAPPHAQGAFIVANTALDAFTAVRRLLGTAHAEVLLVDPEADARTLTDFAVLVPHNVVIRLLADETTHRKSLESATRRWIQQFGDDRPLFVRLAEPGAARDVLILLDSTTAWALGHPLSKMIKVTHTTLVRIPAQATAGLISRYADRWDASVPLLEP